MSGSKVDSVFRTRSLGVAAAGNDFHHFWILLPRVKYYLNKSFYNLSILLLLHFIKGLTDQYADGKAAKVWQLYIGDSEDRTSTYKKFLIDQLKKRNCKSILDAACGTGYVYLEYFCKDK